MPCLLASAACPATPADWSFPTSSDSARSIASAAKLGQGSNPSQYPVSIWRGSLVPLGSASWCVTPRYLEGMTCRMFRIGLVREAGRRRVPVQHDRRLATGHQRERAGDIPHDDGTNHRDHPDHDDPENPANPLHTHVDTHHRAAANRCGSIGSPSQASPAAPFFIIISEISALPHKIAMCDDGQPHEFRRNGTAVSERDPSGP